MKIRLKQPLRRTASVVRLGFCVLCFPLLLRAQVPQLRIKQVSHLPNGQLRIEHAANNNSYYVLLRGDEVTQIRQPVDAQLFATDPGILTDPAAPTQSAFYIVLQVPM